MTAEAASHPVPGSDVLEMDVLEMFDTLERYPSLMPLVAKWPGGETVAAWTDHHRAVFEELDQIRAEAVDGFERSFAAGQWDNAEEWAVVFARTKALGGQLAEQNGPASALSLTA